MTKATLAQATYWLAAVGVPHMNNVEKPTAKVIIRPMAASLIKDYGAEVFCEGSREAVSATLRFFKEPDIRERLDVWCRINIQDVHALPQEAEDAPVSREIKLWLAMFYRADTDDKAERALDVIRGHSEDAFGWLVENDTRAASAAVWRKWVTPARTSLAAEWDDPAMIQEMARKLCTLPRGPSRVQARIFDIGLAALVQAIKVNAPQHGEALFAELHWIASGGRAAETVTVPPPLPEITTGMFGE